MFALIAALGFSQTGGARKCINAEPLCGSSKFTYTNVSGIVRLENGPDYGCLVDDPSKRNFNPSWFYLQIDQPGDIELKIEQSTVNGGTPDLDVDFVLYGAFADPTSPCVADLTASKIVDCSWSPDDVEIVSIPNTQPGEFYILLITNFELQPGYITVTQTAGSATTNCVLVEDPVTVTQQGCQGTPETLYATTPGATHYQWYEDDGAGNFIPIPSNTTASHDVSDEGLYKAEAVNASGVIIKIYEFDVSFIETVDFTNPIDPFIICDYFNDNDGIAEFNLDTKTAQLLNGYNASHFKVTYYKSDVDANSGTATPLPSLYTNTQQTETLYVRVENVSVSTPQCATVGQFDIEVILLPETTLENGYTLCTNTNGTEEIPTPPLIDTYLSEAEHTFVWRLGGTVLPTETNSYIYPANEGDYEVEFTNINTGCTNYASTFVEFSEPPRVTAEIISRAFVETNTIEVTATALGPQDFEYRMDNGPWQTQNRFEDVSIGEHGIAVRNLSGCGQTSITVMVMDYPHYFTPNGDGDHETWNIVGLKNQLQATIHIYDRYGKLIKQLDPKSEGWDGTFNGIPMPTSDYWFTVAYIEPRDGLPKLFKAHFTLKR